MRCRRFLLLIAVFAFLLGLSSCRQSAATRSVATNTTVPSTVSGTEGYAKQTGTMSPTSLSPLVPAESAAAVIESASKGINAVTTYRLSRGIAVAKRITSNGMTQEYDLFTQSDMALDISARKMQMENSFDTKQSTGQSEAAPVANSLFIVNDVVYIQGLFPDQPQQWAKTSVSEDYWRLQDQAKQLNGLLRLTSSAVLAPETVHSGSLNIPCDVVQVDPDPDKLWALLLQQPGIETLQLPLQSPPGIAFSQIIKNAKMKLWVAQASGFPVKAELTMSMQIGPAVLASLTNDVSMDVSISMLFYDHNQRIPIELPKAAQDAPELSEAQSP